MDLGIDGRTVIVTGASGGIGRHIARAFAAEGARVVVTYHSAQHEAEQLSKELGERAHAVPYALDDDAATPAPVQAALDWTGRVDVLVNNAVDWGHMASSAERPFEAVPDGEWVELTRANIEGALRLSRAVAPSMRERRWGRMVHISSSLVTEGMAGAEYYAAAKAALHGFSRSVAFSLGADGDILSNVVMPGLTRTDTNGAIIEAAGAYYSAKAPIGRLLNAEEVARPIVYLGSAANTGITGQVIGVSGGV